jgi:hypothetical protein
VEKGVHAVPTLRNRSVIFYLHILIFRIWLQIFF